MKGNSRAISIMLSLLVILPIFSVQINNVSAGIVSTMSLPISKATSGSHSSTGTYTLLAGDWDKPDDGSKWWARNENSGADPEHFILTINFNRLTIEGIQLNVQGLATKSGLQTDPHGKLYYKFYNGNTVVKSDNTDLTTNVWGGMTVSQTGSWTIDRLVVQIDASHMCEISIEYCYLRYRPGPLNNNFDSFVWSEPQDWIETKPVYTATKSPKFSIGIQSGGYGADAASLKYDVARYNPTTTTWANTATNIAFSLNTLTSVAASAITQTGYYRIIFKGNDIYGNTYNQYTSYFYYDITPPTTNFTLYEGHTFGIYNKDQELQAPILDFWVNATATSPNRVSDLAMFTITCTNPYWVVSWTDEGADPAIVRDLSDLSLYHLDLTEIWSSGGDDFTFTIELSDYCENSIIHEAFLINKDTDPISATAFMNLYPDTNKDYNTNPVYGVQGLSFTCVVTIDLDANSIEASQLAAVEFSFDSGNTWEFVPISGIVNGETLTMPLAFTLPSADGSYTMAVRTTDLYNNQMVFYDSIDIIVDTSLPIVEVTTYPEIVSSNFEVQFFITELTLDMTGYRIIDGSIIHKPWTYWDNIFAQSPQVATIIWPAGLVDGTYTIQINATDSYGRNRGDAIQVSLCTSGPELTACTINDNENPTISNPAIIGSTLNMEWTTDSGSPLNAVYSASYGLQELGEPSTFEIIGSASYGSSPVYTDTFGFSLATYPEGDYVLVLALTNSIDAISTYSYYFTLDKTLPTLACSNMYLKANSPIPVLITETNPAELQYMFNLVEYTVDISAHSPASSPFSVQIEIPEGEFDALSEGEYAIDITIIDQAANSHTISRTITIDQTAPIVSIFTDAARTVLLTNNTYWNTAPTFFAVISEPLAYDVTVRALTLTQHLGQTTAIAIPEVLFDVFDDLATIIYEIDITDAAGNAEHYLVFVKKDVVVPQCAISFPATNQLIGVSPPTFAFSASDSALSYGRITILDQTSLDTKYTYDLTAGEILAGSHTVDTAIWETIESGDYTVDVEVWDRASNYIKVTKVFSVDKLAPLLTIKAPAMYAAVSASAPVFIIECSDDHLESVIYYIEGQDSQFTIPADGYTGVIDQDAWDLIETKTVKLHFIATDKVGNSVETVVVVYRDDIASDGWNREPVIDFENLTYDMPTNIILLLVGTFFGTIALLSLPETVKKRAMKGAKKAADLAKQASDVTAQAYQSGQSVSKFMTNADKKGIKWRP